ncbi:hypothetical protein VP01_741g2 [Puccinia sorghi]|uniref:Uncharacterized protein n=1 Tax=Puccinia sorghi TaxID=27349 RepID=A0A0L6UCJ9_9BASI|nr:hypothetical protein VP01_741g2 [Puccinia sorghi]
MKVDMQQFKVSSYYVFFTRNNIPPRRPLGIQHRVKFWSLSLCIPKPPLPLPTWFYHDQLMFNSFQKVLTRCDNFAYLSGPKIVPVKQPRVVRSKKVYFFSNVTCEIVRIIADLNFSSPSNILVYIKPLEYVKTYMSPQVPSTVQMMLMAMKNANYYDWKKNSLMYHMAMSWVEEKNLVCPSFQTCLYIDYILGIDTFLDISHQTGSNESLGHLHRGDPDGNSPQGAILAPCVIPKHCSMIGDHWDDEMGGVRSNWPFQPLFQNFCQQGIKFPDLRSFCYQLSANVAFAFSQYFLVLVVICKLKIFSTTLIVSHNFFPASNKRSIAYWELCSILLHCTTHANQVINWNQNSFLASLVRI